MVIRQPTDDEIMRALCCDGGQCREEPFVMFCHRWDFQTEVARIRALLERCEVHLKIRIEEEGA